MADALLVSACLCGLPTRYDGTGRTSSALFAYLQQHDAVVIPLCPEQLGGLPTPRPRCCFAEGDGEALLDGGARIVSETGERLDESFLRGAEAVVAVAGMSGARLAILKEGSPSCGVRRIDRRGERVAGCGVTTALLRRHGIQVLSDEELSTQ